MKKDGTKYLALIKSPNGRESWNVISWTKPCAFSDPYMKEWWVSGFFALKIDKILIAYELNPLLDIAKTLENAVDNSDGL